MIVYTLSFNMGEQVEELVECLNFIWKRFCKESREELDPMSVYCTIQPYLGFAKN